MRLRIFFSFFGAKWMLAPHYPAPRHDRIVEPFAGSACYSLLYPDRDVWLFDLDEFIVGVWDYLIRAPSSEILALPDLEVGAKVSDIPRISQEARWLIGFWVNSASARPKQTLTQRLREHPSVYWGPRIRDRIARQQASIRHWHVHQATYQDIPNPTHGSTWFVDPPYQRSGKYYRHHSGRIDFKHLGLWCRDRVGQTIVCEQEGAEWLPFRHLRECRSQRCDRYGEVIWTS